MFNVGDRVKLISDRPSWNGRKGTVTTAEVEVAGHDVVETYSVKFDDGSRFTNIPGEALRPLPDESVDAQSHATDALAYMNATPSPWLTNAVGILKIDGKPVARINGFNVSIPPQVDAIREQRKKDGCCLDCGEKGKFDPRTFHMVCSKHGPY